MLDTVKVRERRVQTLELDRRMSQNTSLPPVQDRSIETMLE